MSRPPAARLLAALLAAVGALALAGCGGGEAPRKREEPAPPVDPAGEQLTVTHILIKGSPSPAKGERAKEKAKELATEILGEIQGGANFDELVKRWTGDLDQNKKPNTNNGRPGSYTWPTPTMPRMVPEFEKASRGLKVGMVSPEPVETTFGYHIIRRDALIPATK